MSDLSTRFTRMLDPMTRGTLVVFDPELGPLVTRGIVFQIAVGNICEFAEEHELTTDVSVQLIGAYCWAMKNKKSDKLPSMPNWPLAFFAVDTALQKLLNAITGPNPDLDAEQPWALVYVTDEYTIGPVLCKSREAAKTKFMEIVDQKSATTELLLNGNYRAWKEVEGIKQLIATTFPLTRLKSKVDLTD